ncbi:winged helix-turn-helix transcriptional regulator [Winogradskyella undariae]|nr:MULTISPECIES: metalloregulator ArsR/SmtB family transcription factor [Winogradskyella]NRR91808.1 winged helix-turn-helix transcriptional regulator [Winogradskyella undariae]QNK78939.1 winged helix-turn-helix transcriptional regulator [Winogradskyella sp. PAMC22761]QXP78015.1 winged helix-turn-helix transcriptional regulator [Winogradskyella sp. HaHa_3_26]
MDNYIKTFKALSDPTRLKIVWLLTNINEKICVSEIVEVLEEYQYNVSRHLKVLKKANLIEEVKEGKWVFYYLSPIKDEFSHIIKNSISSIPEKEMIKEMTKCKALLSHREKK